MNEQNIIVYISDNSSQCEELVKKLNHLDINFKQKNVTENREYLGELQEKGIFGTPATFIDEKVILGSQINQIKHALGMLDSYQSYNSFKKP